MSSELARRGTLDVHQVLSVATALARGLVHLHGQGLVHRDIKPSNVIFVHGRARLADISLVDHEGRSSFTGTDGYVAPEGTGTPSADLYSLGLVLYEIATGCDRKQFPRLPPEWLRPSDPIRWELHDVILRACEGQIERRYGSAVELEGDLAVISSGDSVRERRAMARRSRRLKITGALMTAGFLIALGWGLLSRQRATMDHDARLQAERLHAETELALVESNLAQAAANRQTGRTGQRYETLDRIAEALERLRRLATNAVAPLSAARQASLIETARDEAVAASTRVDLREMGRWRVSFDRQWGMPADAELRRLALVGPSNTIQVVAIPEGVQQVELPAGPTAIERLGPFNPDGEYLMVRYKNRENWVWNLQERQVVFRQTNQGTHLRAVFWRGGVLVPAANERLTWHSLTDPSEQRSYTVSEQLMWLIPAWDGEHVVGFTRWFKEACLLGGEPLKELKRRRLPNGVNMGELAISPDGQTLAFAGVLGQESVMNLGDQDVPPARLAGHAAEVVAMAFHPDGRYLATSSWDGTTRIWEWAIREVRLVHPHWAASLCFSKDGSRCAMITGDSPEAEIILCQVAIPNSVRSWRPDPLKTNQLAKKVGARCIFSPGGQWLAMGTAHGVCLMSVPDLQTHATLGSNEIYAVRFSPEGDRLFTAGKDGRRVWDITALMSAKQEGSLGNAGGWVTNNSYVPGQDERQLTLGPDGQPLAVLRGMRAFYRPDATADWQAVREVGGTEWMTTSRDGAWMAVACPKRLRLLRLSDTSLLWETQTHGICRFDFSPDGQSLLALDPERLSCFDTISGEVRWHVPRVDPYLRVGDVAWSSEGRLVAAALVRRDVSLIDAATGRVAVRLANPTETGICATAFSPTGRYLAVTLVDQSAQLWDLDTIHQELAKLGLDWDLGRD